MIKTTTFARVENGALSIGQSTIENHTEKIAGWLVANGLQQFTHLTLDGTPTLCSQGTMTNTNTRDNDDTLDNVQDQVTDDSSD